MSVFQGGEKGNACLQPPCFSSVSATSKVSPASGRMFEIETTAGRAYSQPRETDVFYSRSRRAYGIESVLPLRPLRSLTPYYINTSQPSLFSSCTDTTFTFFRVMRLNLVSANIPQPSPCNFSHALREFPLFEGSGRTA